VKLPAVAKRASWNLIDQMISSLTNAVLSFMVARAVDPVTFGGFAVAFTVFTLVIGGARALCTSPLNIRFSDAEPAEQKRAAAAATGLSLLIAAVVGLGTVVAGLVLGGSTGEALLVMGLVLPAVIVQDSYRYVFFSRQTPVKAAVNDGAWAVLQIGAVAGLLFAGVSSVGPFVLVWGVAGLAAVLLALRQSATLPNLRTAPGWLREQNNLTRYTFASWATQQGTMQGALLVIAAVGTVVANGALRGAQILLGPAAIISSSALTFAIPEFSRRRRTMTDRQWVLAASGVSGVVAFLALCWGAIFLLMPDSVGEYLLNETWAGTRELLVAAVVGQVLSCLTVGPVVMLYAIDRAKATFRIHIVLGTLVFAGGVGGVLLAGGPGAQWGFAIANGVVLPFWFVRLWRELRPGPPPGRSRSRPTTTSTRGTRGHRGPGSVPAPAGALLPRPRVRPDGDDGPAAHHPAGARPGAPRPAATPPGVRPSPGPRPSPVPRARSRATRCPTRSGPGRPRSARPRSARPVPHGPVPPGFAVPVPPGALPPRPPVPAGFGRPGVEPHQETRAHVLPPLPPPRPSRRARPEQPAPDDATATVVTPAPVRSGSTARDPAPAGTARPGTPVAGPTPAGSGGAEPPTTVHHVVGPAGPGRDAPPAGSAPPPEGWSDPSAGAGAPPHPPPAAPPHTAAGRARHPRPRTAAAPPTAPRRQVAATAPPARPPRAAAATGRRVAQRRPAARPAAAPATVPGPRAAVPTTGPPRRTPGTARAPGAPGAPRAGGPTATGSPRRPPSGWPGPRTTGAPSS
jgi:O-antigen/teichoic acid export membrane protein